MGGRCAGGNPPCGGAARGPLFGGGGGATMVGLRKKRNHMMNPSATTVIAPKIAMRAVFELSSASSEPLAGLVVLTGLADFLDLSSGFLSAGPGFARLKTTGTFLSFPAYPITAR